MQSNDEEDELVRQLVEQMNEQLELNDLEVPLMTWKLGCVRRARLTGASYSYSHPKK